MQQRGKLSIDQQKTGKARYCRPQPDGQKQYWERWEKPDELVFEFTKF
jgi:hypothetical protein